MAVTSKHFFTAAFLRLFILYLICNYYFSNFQYGIAVLKIHGHGIASNAAVITPANLQGKLNFWETPKPVIIFLKKHGKKLKKRSNNMEKKKPERTRKIPVQVYFDEEEMAFIESNMKRANIKTKSDYIRQMCIFGKVINYDDLDFRKCFNELTKIGSLINQIARVANRTESIYEKDIQLLKDKYSSISDTLEEMFLKIDTLLEKTEKTKFLIVTEQINEAVEKLHAENYL